MAVRKLQHREGGVYFCTLYGSSRVGVDNYELELCALDLANYDPLNDPPGDQRYELSDHLGNVTSVLTDELLGVDVDADLDYDYFQPHVVSAQGYEPFGSLLPGRNYNSGATRFGFNGKENDNEVHNATGTFQDYGMRSYDTRLGRFISVDPIASQYPMLTPYQFASNTPIWGIDLDGEELRIYTESGNFARANVGHTFVSIGNEKDIVVYTYGRWDDVAKAKGSLGATNLSGEGVLIKLKGQSATDYIGKSIETYGAKVFEITDIDMAGEERAKSFLETKFNSSNELPDREGGSYFNDPRAHVIDKYSLLNNNCTTISCGAAEQTGTQVFNDFDYVTPLKPDGAKPVKIPAKQSFFVPAGLQQYLEYKSKTQDAPVKEVTDDVKPGQ